VTTQVNLSRFLNFPAFLRTGEYKKTKTNQNWHKGGGKGGTFQSPAPAFFSIFVMECWGIFDAGGKKTGPRNKTTGLKQTKHAFISTPHQENNNQTKSRIYLFMVFWHFRTTLGGRRRNNTKKRTNKKGKKKYKKKKK